MVCVLGHRDRAEERRRGINPDYVNANQLAAVLGTGGDVDVSKLSMEESKFLGGDLEHTHLVRGLDYALLQKVRAH
jgi:IK cytokine